jgi:predicted nicotinamide N-methyase
VSEADDLHALDASLRRRFRVVQTAVDIAGRTLSILHPASAEELIDEGDFERDERLPYWAELWPSARILAEWVWGQPGNGRSLLELGCGAGLVATAASLAGFEVVASDYYEDAPRFARVNAWRNGAPPIRGLVLDWRALPASLPRFEVVVASDVLYERPYGPLVARVIAATLAAGGVAWVADPGRVGREAFLDALDENGLIVRSQRAVAFVDGQIRQEITVLEIARSD